MFKKMTKYIPFAIFCLLITGCEKKGEEKKKEPEKLAQVTLQKEKEGVNIFQHALAVIEGKEGNEVVGAVTFSEVEGGVKITADISGLKPGQHGFHIHEHGDCSASDASSAGGHYNPFKKKHGGPESAERHVGDFGNLEANKNGFAHYERVDHLITLRGEHSIIGKSVVIHADPDDLKTDPSGNAGKRIGCGEIISANLE